MPVEFMGHKLGTDDDPRGARRADGEVQRVPGGQLQLLAVDPRQRRGGALGRQGGELGQALRQRPRSLWRRPGSEVANILKKVRGIENVGLFHIVGQPNLEIQIDRQACAAMASTWPTSRPPCRSRSAARRSRRWSRARSSTTSSCGCRSHLRDDPNVISRIPVDVARRRRQARGYGFRWRSWPRSTRTSRVPRTSTARTTGDSSRSSSASRTATSPRRSTRPRQKVYDDPKTGGQVPRGLPTSSGRASSPRCRTPTRG